MTWCNCFSTFPHCLLLSVWKLCHWPSSIRLNCQNYKLNERISSLWLVVNTVVIDIEPVWNPNLDVSSSEVEVKIEMARVEFNAKEMTTLRLSNVIHLHLNILPFQTCCSDRTCSHFVWCWSAKLQYPHEMPLVQNVFKSFVQFVRHIFFCEADVFETFSNLFLIWSKLGRWSRREGGLGGQCSM